MPRYESKSGAFLELEVEDTVLRQLEGPAGASDGKRRERVYRTADEAQYAGARLVARYRTNRGYRIVGDGQYYGARREVPAPVASVVALEAYFTAGDPQFLAELLRATAAAKLGALAERWYTDTRTWAREALLAYIDDGCDRPMHRALVKRLFKRAEAAGDDELMAHFMVAFDRLSRRFLIEQRRPRWDSVAQQLVTAGGMRWVPDTSLPRRVTPTKHRKLPRIKRAPDDDPQFSRLTRRYLARRAYRYFRKLAHRDVARYGRAMQRALPLYTDASLATVARLFDAWGLMHVLYARSPVIVRSSSGIRLAAGRSLAELAPAPHFDAAWAEQSSELLALVVQAGSRTVRAWAVAMLRARHAAALAELAYPAVKQLITSPHDEVVALGAELFGRLAGLETLPLTEWLALLALDNLDVLPVIAQLAARAMSPARLGLAQCIDLACSKAAAVAQLGLAWAKAKPIAQAGAPDHGDAAIARETQAALDDLRQIARLARAGVATVRVEGTAWALEIIAAHAATRPEHVRDLCDGPHEDARALALAVVAGHARFASEPALWLALAESPYPDVRGVVIRHLTRWRDHAPVATLRHVWATAVLTLYGAGKLKARVAREIVDRIAAHPDEASALLPLLGHALRSVRPTERALGLGALARVARANPALGELVQQLLPELTLSAQVSS